MTLREPEVAVKVRGDYACFTRPEFKAERVTYPVMTPSAARGLLEAIFWKPEFRWQIVEVHVLREIRQTAVLRNELKDPQGGNPIFIEDKRQPRTSLILKDVEYLVKARICLRPEAKDLPIKYEECFLRRLDKGQYHHTPYLGTREFAAEFEPADGTERPCDIRMNIGQMLFDIAYCEDPKRDELQFWKHSLDGTRREARGYAQAVFFTAHIGKETPGVLKIPREKYEEVYRLESGHA